MRTIEREFRFGQFLDEVYHLFRIQCVPSFDSRFAGEGYQGVVDRLRDLYVGMWFFGESVEEISDSLSGNAGR